MCPVCDGIYEEEGDDSSVWVECIGCEEWFHLHCTSIPPRKMASNPPPFVEVAAGSRAPVERQRVAQSALQISRRSLCWMATWNCRSLLKQAQKDVLARELSRKDITLAAVQESRLAKQGDIHIGQGYRLLYSGVEKAGQKGVGIAISSEAYKALIAWEAISDRLMSATFCTPFGKLHVLSAYAPTNKPT